jgi:hypothetical protein
MAAVFRKRRHFFDGCPWGKEQRVEIAGNRAFARRAVLVGAGALALTGPAPPVATAADTCLNAERSGGACHTARPLIYQGA